MSDEKPGGKKQFTLEDIKARITECELKEMELLEEIASVRKMRKECCALLIGFSVQAQKKLAAMDKAFGGQDPPAPVPIPPGKEPAPA